MAIALLPLFSGCETDVSGSKPYDSFCSGCVSDASIEELRGLVLKVANEHAADDVVVSVLAEISSSDELRAALMEVLVNGEAEDGESTGASPYIFLAGRIGAIEFVPVLYDLASGVLQQPHQRGSDAWQQSEIERLLAFESLAELGALEALEDLMEVVPTHTHTALRLELNRMDSERWPMLRLPTAILTDYRADQQYREHYENRLAELRSNGIVVPDDELEDEEHDDDDVEARDESDTPAPVHHISGAEYLERSATDPNVQVTLAEGPIYGCGITSPARATSNEVFYASTPWCTNAIMAKYWNGYSFNSSWNSSMGFETPCDLNQPLGRVFNAIHLLHTASASPPVSDSDMGGDILRWGGNYAMREIPSFRASCATDAIATTNAAVLKKNRHVTMKRSSFYSRSTAERASTIIHEARHTERCRHNGNDGSNPCPANSSSCDESLYDGCRDLALAPNGAGAVGFQVSWMQAYLESAPANRISAYHRTRIKASVNSYLNTFLDVEPFFNVNLDGSIFYHAR